VLSVKTCAYCGRVMEPRRKWTGEERYCSERCRRTKRKGLDEALEAAILELLGERARGKTICPSEAARAVADDWREAMERTRCAARRLVAEGKVEITQKGRVVDPSRAKGPIRLRLAQ